MDFSGMGAPTPASPASPAPSPERSGAGPGSLGCGSRTMPSERRILRCAIYTRKSSEHGLEQDFNSLDAKREAGESYIKSQAHEGCSHPEIGSHPGNPGLLIAANAIVASETRHARRCGARGLFGCA